jgi:hypothetical protein
MGAQGECVSQALKDSDRPGAVIQAVKMCKIDSSAFSRYVLMTQALAFSDGPG